MTLQAHLKELRRRLFVVAVVFTVAASAAYMVRDTLLSALLAPLGGQKLAYLNPGGGFSFVFAVTMWTGLALTMPVIVSSLYGFIAPALPARARSRGGLIFTGSVILFAAGAAFGYLYAIPAALRFLVGFGDGYVQAMLTADAYLNFVLLYTVGLGLLFQLPIIMMVIHWITPLKPKKLLAFERYVVAGAFVAAAFMTPTPDVVNQAIVAAPFIGMYQVGLVGVSVSQWRRAKRARRSARQENRREVRPAVAPLPPQPTVVAAVLAAPATVPTPVALSLPTTHRSSRTIDGISRSQTSLRVPTRVAPPVAPPERPLPARSPRVAMDIF